MDAKGQLMSALQELQSHGVPPCGSNRRSATVICGTVVLVVLAAGRANDGITQPACSPNGKVCTRARPRGESAVSAFTSLTEDALRVTASALPMAVAESDAGRERRASGAAVSFEKLLDEDGLHLTTAACHSEPEGQVLWYGHVRAFTDADVIAKHGTTYVIVFQTTYLVPVGKFVAEWGPYEFAGATAETDEVLRLFSMCKRGLNISAMRRSPATCAYSENLEDRGGTPMPSLLGEAGSVNQVTLKCRANDCKTVMARRGQQELSAPADYVFYLEDLGCSRLRGVAAFEGAREAVQGAVEWLDKSIRSNWLSAIEKTLDGSPAFDDLTDPVLNGAERDVALWMNGELRFATGRSLGTTPTTARELQARSTEVGATAWQARPCRRNWYGEVVGRLLVAPRTGGGGRETVSGAALIQYPHGSFIVRFGDVKGSLSLRLSGLGPLVRSGWRTQIHVVEYINETVRPNGTAGDTQKSVSEGLRVVPRARADPSSSTTSVYVLEDKLGTRYSEYETYTSARNAVTAAVSLVADRMRSAWIGISDAEDP